jgi:hypothetical protein
VPVATPNAGGAMPADAPDADAEMPAGAPDAGSGESDGAPQGGGEAAVPDEQEDVEGDDDGSGAISMHVERATGPRRARPHLDPVASADPRGLGRRGLVLSAATLDAAPPERRFLRAVRQPPARGGRPDDAQVLEELATAPVLGIGRVPYASNAVFLLELDAPAATGPRRLRAVYKPRRGERPLWDFPAGTLHLREVATYLVDAALGFGLVPPTVLRDGPHGPGSVQMVVDVADEPVRGADRGRLEAQLLQLGVLDALVNNADRKSAHLLVTEDARLQGIDHGLTFLPYPRQRTVLVGLGGALLSEDSAGAVRALQADGARRSSLLEHLGMLLSAAEVRAFAGRLEELAADPVYPELDPWDGRPFEWW